MIPDVVSIVFLVIPWLCLVYIFKGLTSDANPIWGNVLASGIGVLVAAMVAIWFIQGTIVSPTIVSNATYQLSGDLTAEEMLAQQAAASNTSTVIGAGGSGMFLRSGISASSGSNLTNQTTVSIHTYDIVYQQYSDAGMMMLYMLLAVVLSALFLWFIADMRRFIKEQDDYDEFMDE
jgi:hypothetical protein